MLVNLGIGFVVGVLVGLYFGNKKIKEIMQKIFKFRLKKKEEPLIVPTPVKRTRKPRAKKIVPATPTSAVRPTNLVEP